MASTPPARPGTPARSIWSSDQRRAHQRAVRGQLRRRLAGRRAEDDRVVAVVDGLDRASPARRAGRWRSSPSTRRRGPRAPCRPECMKPSTTISASAGIGRPVTGPLSTVTGSPRTPPAQSYSHMSGGTSMRAGHEQQRVVAEATSPPASACRAAKYLSRMIRPCLPGEM